jgi:hypothetical protein
MDYLTINVNKRFLAVVGLIVGLYVAGKFIYHRGYVDGGSDVFKYLQQMQDGKQSRIDNSL